jgi:subtilisin family serine protease
MSSPLLTGRRTLAAYALAVAPAAVAACADGVPLAPRAPGGPRASVGVVTEAGPGRYVVGLADGDLSTAALEAAGGRVVDSIPAIRAVVLDGVTDPGALAAAGVRYAEPDATVAPDPVQVDGATVPADATAASAAPADDAVADAIDPSSAPWFASGVQWDMKVMRADRVWSASPAGAGVNACIVDSGFDEAHQELAGKLVASRSFVPNNPSNPTQGFSPVPLDSAGHGTHVASTVSGNGRVMASVAPAARLLAAKVLAANNSGQYTWIIAGMAWCADQGAHVMNVSIGSLLYVAPGGSVQANPTYQALADVVRYATDRGVVVVFSAGNSNVQLPNANQYAIPAQVPGTIVVGATGPVTRMVGTVAGGALANVPIALPPAWDPTDPGQVWQGPDGRAFYSNFGTAVDVFAPGGRGGVPLSFPRRVALVAPGTVRTVQGGPHDNVWAACSRFSTYAGALNTGGVPVAVGSCANAADRYASLAGTSMAAPHVTGLAAVLYSELGGAPSPERRARIEACIRSTADAVGPSSVYGRGRINAERALAALRAGAC